MVKTHQQVDLVVSWALIYAATAATCCAVKFASYQWIYSLVMSHVAAVQVLPACLTVGLCQ